MRISTSLDPPLPSDFVPPILNEVALSPERVAAVFLSFASAASAPVALVKGDCPLSSEAPACGGESGQARRKGL